MKHRPAAVNRPALRASVPAALDPEDHPPEADKPRRGRPRDPRRVEAVVEAARLAFAANGFERTSMDDIAAASGVSKMTVYSYFPTKEVLYSATVVNTIDRGLPAEALAALDPQDPGAGLLQLGLALLRLMRQDDVLGCHRAVIGSAVPYGELARQFLAAGPERIVADVARYLKAARDAGSLELPQVHQGADQFVSLFLGLDHWRAVLAIGKPSDRHDRALAKANVELFMRAYGTR